MPILATPIPAPSIVDRLRRLLRTVAAASSARRVLRQTADALVVMGA